MPVRYSVVSAGPDTRRRDALEPTAVVETVEAAPDFSGWTKAELQALADDRGLDASGTKATLIARLTA